MVIWMTGTMRRVAIQMIRLRQKNLFRNWYFSCASSDDEEDKPYDVFLKNYHMIFLKCKKFKE